MQINVAYEKKRVTQTSARAEIWNDISASYATQRWWKRVARAGWGSKTSLRVYKTWIPILSYSL